jgi:hypothetical protein
VSPLIATAGEPVIRSRNFQIVAGSDFDTADCISSKAAFLRARVSCHSCASRSLKPGFGRESRNGGLDLIERHTEEFLPEVRHVDPAFRELLVRGSFNCWSGIAVDHCVNVEAERHTGVAKLVDAVVGVETRCEPNLNEIFAERAYVRDDES